MFTTSLKRSKDRGLLGVVIAVLALAAIAVGAPIAAADQLHGWPNYDIRYDPDGPVLGAAARGGGVSPDTSGRPAAERRLQDRVGSVSFSYDQLFETPRFIRSTSNFLVEADPTNPRDAAQVVRDFLTDFRDLFLIEPEELTNTRIARDATSPISGARNIRYQQQIGGVDVFGAQLRATVTKEGHLLNVSSLLLDSRLANFEPQQPVISATLALLRAAADIGVFPDSPPVVMDVDDGPTQKHTFATSADFWYPPSAQLTYFPMSPFEVRIAWEVLLPEEGTFNIYRTIVDAVTADVLYRVNLTQRGTQPATYRVYTSDSPAPASPRPPGAPMAYQAPVVDRQLVSLIALDDVASPNGWIDDGDNSTEGNNVTAIIDHNFNGSPDEIVEGSPARVFDFPLSLASDPDDYRKAACVSLFYWCNVIHDRYYELGFDEASGNFQWSNFGRGGFGNDAVLALCQAGAGVGLANNAWFATPEDGASGIMAMYVWTGPSPDRDGSLDADIVVHEHTHGLSWRLHGKNGLGTSQSDGMGEGWSDFYALSLLAEPGDDPDGIYAYGAYSTFELGGSDYHQNYYFGIRRYPYSTDLNVNPLTFEDIDPTKIELPAAVPVSPVFSDAGLLDASEVHNAGEVWCVTLWDCRANIMARAGFAGNETMLKIVTEAMKISPPQPNFVEARDAILQADVIVTGGNFYNELWEGFAKRGMGSSAVAPGSSSNIGVIEAADTPRPIAAARASTRAGNAPLTIKFSGVAENLALGGRAARWSFGNGDSLDGTTVSYTYTTPGSYLAVFEASDASGKSANASISVDVLGQEAAIPGVLLSVSANPTTGAPPLPVVFTATISGASLTDIVSWNWVFGDGTGDVGQSVAHTYAKAGAYTAMVTATTSDGLGLSRSVQINVIAGGAAQLAPTGSSQGCGLLGLPAMIMLVGGTLGLAFIRRRRA